MLEKLVRFSFKILRLLNRQKNPENLENLPELKIYKNKKLKI